ncbi:MULTISPECIES: hypothetical protein [Bacillus]|uniref:hypothetical protein n=1 Tax=Bacillus TaxID=1386 RepID=UPI0008FE1ABE|nr:MULTISPECIES: hypothetical protein [Bacillus]OJE32425.1 hypothetical protein BAQ44_22325 [Bacillus mobilis]HDR7243185.1 hypothetical protein [Bacillus mobilis]
MFDASAIGKKVTEEQEVKSEVVEEKQEIKQEGKSEVKQEEKTEKKDKKGKQKEADYSLRTKKEKTPLGRGRMKKDPIKKTYYIEKEIALQLAEEAFELGTSPSNLIERLFKDYMKKKK